MPVTLSRRRTANLAGALALGLVDRLRADSEAAALVSLLERGPLTIEWLRRIVGLTHSATVRLVDRLAAAGLVERAAGPDARSVSVLLTRGGRSEAKRLRDERAEVLAVVLATLDERERDQFTRLAEKLLRGMTPGRWPARLTCRLCDHGVCQTGGCPVDQAATELGE